MVELPEAPKERPTEGSQPPIEPWPTCPHGVSKHVCRYCGRMICNLYGLYALGAPLSCKDHAPSTALQAR